MDYFARLVAGEIVLMPYYAERYAARASGVFADAAACGLPVVVPAHTWMSRLIAAGTVAGTVFESLAAETVAEALARAVSQLSALKARAEAGRDQWRATENIFEFTRRLVVFASEATESSR